MDWSTRRFSGRSFPFLPVLLTALAFPVACSEDAAAPPESTDAVALVNVSTHVPGVTYNPLWISVSAPDIPRPLRFTMLIDELGHAAGTLALPPGEGRTIRMAAFYAVTGWVAYEGSVVRDLRPGENPAVVIELEPREDHD